MPIKVSKSSHKFDLAQIRLLIWDWEPQPLTLGQKRQSCPMLRPLSHVSSISSKSTMSISPSPSITQSRNQDRHSKTLPASKRGWVEQPQMASQSLTHSHLPTAPTIAQLWLEPSGMTSISISPMPTSLRPGRRTCLQSRIVALRWSSLRILLTMLIIEILNSSQIKIARRWFSTPRRQTSRATCWTHQSSSRWIRETTKCHIIIALVVEEKKTWSTI